MDGLVEVFERQERRAAVWAAAHSHGVLYTSDAEGTLLLPGLLCDERGAPDLRLPGPGGAGGDWVANADASTAEFHPGELTTANGWLAVEGAHGDGWQYASDWHGTFGSAAVAGKLVGNSKVRRRRWVCPVRAVADTARLLERVAPAHRRRLDVHLHAVRHVLLLVHGVGVYDAPKLRRKVSEMRHTRAALVRAGLPDALAPAVRVGPAAPAASSPLAPWLSGACGHIDVCPVSWHDGRPGTHISDAAAALESLQLPGTRVVRDFVQKSMLNAALYLGGYRGHIEAAVAAAANEALLAFVAAHPGLLGREALISALLAQPQSLTGGEGATAFLPVRPVRAPQVSLFSHSLGSVISFDLLCQRGNVATPQLRFIPAALFAVGSPIGFYLTLRNTDAETTRTFMSRLVRGVDLACPAAHTRLFNILHPKDPIALLLSPILLPPLPGDASGHPPAHPVLSYQGPATKKAHGDAMKAVAAAQGIRVAASANGAADDRTPLEASPDGASDGPAAELESDSTAAATTPPPDDAVPSTPPATDPPRRSRALVAGVGSFLVGSAAAVGRAASAVSAAAAAARGGGAAAPVAAAGSLHPHGVDYLLPAETMSPSTVLSAAMGPLGEFLLALQGHKDYWLSPDCLELITLRVLAMQAEELRAVATGTACTCDAPSG